MPIMKKSILSKTESGKHQETESLSAQENKVEKKLDGKKKAKLKIHSPKATPPNEMNKLNDFKKIEMNEGSGDVSVTIENLEPLSDILRELEESKEKVLLTRKEKKCLEDILALTTQIKDGESVPDVGMTLTDCPEAQSEVAANSSRLMVTELGEVTAYLKNLKSLIAKRETTWVETNEENKQKQLEISRLNDEITNLLVSCAKMQNEAQGKDKIIAEKDKEIVRLQKLVLKLKGAIVQMERRMVQQEVGVEINNKNKTQSKKTGSEVMQSELEQLVLASQKCMSVDQKNVKPTLEMRKNQGPAAQVANALYRARNAGNFVNF